MQRSLTARLYSRSSVSEVVEPPQSAVYAQEKSAHCFLTDNKEAQPHLRQPVRTVIEDRKRAISFLLLMFAQAVKVYSLLTSATDTRTRQHKTNGTSQITIGTGRRWTCLSFVRLAAVYLGAAAAFV